MYCTGLLKYVARRVLQALPVKTDCSRDCSGSLLAAVERPAGAAVPSLVTAVAVVRFLAIVLLTIVGLLVPL